MKKCWILALFICCFATFLSVKVLGISNSEMAQLLFYKRSSLQGLKEVTCAVQLELPKNVSLPPDFQLVSQSQLQTQVELALRTAGITIVPKRTDKSEPLIVSVSILPASENIYAIWINVALYQRVRLERDNTIITDAPTWPSSVHEKAGWGLRVAGKNRLNESIKEGIADKMSVFCNDYLAAQQPIDKQLSDMYSAFGKIEAEEKAKKKESSSDPTGESVQPTTTEQKNQEQSNEPIKKSPTVIKCETCGHEISRLEKAYVHDGHIVCSQCFLKLKQQP